MKRLSAAAVPPGPSPRMFSSQLTQATSPATRARSLVTMNCNDWSLWNSANHDAEMAAQPCSVAQPGMGAHDLVVVDPHVGHGVDVARLERFVEAAVGGKDVLLGRHPASVGWRGPSPPRQHGDVQTIASTDDVTLAVHDLGGEGPTIVYSHATGLHGLPVGSAGPLAGRLPRHRHRLPGPRRRHRARERVLQLGRVPRRRRRRHRHASADAAPATASATPWAAPCC